MNKYINVLSKTRLTPSLLTEYQSGCDTETTMKLNESIQSSKNTCNMPNTPVTPVRANRLIKNKSSNLFSCMSSQSINNLSNFQLNENLKQLENVNEDLTLLDWIKSTDPNNKIDTVVDDTKDILENFEKNQKWNELSSKINDLLDQIENNAQFREIEGLTKRLEDLKSFLDDSNRLLLSQNEITDSIKTNFERAASLKDESVLKDLSKAHVAQLEIFKQNHSKMVEIANKVSKAKLELIKVIHSRLQWIMQVQKKVADYDFQIQIYFKQLRRVNVRLKLMDQLKKAPYIYVYAMKETLRRIEFSKSYKSFSKLICDLLNNVYQNELKQRKLFNTKTSSLNQHFILNILFRNLNDKFEPFFQDFDDKLPRLDELEVNEIENEIVNSLKIDQSYTVTSPSSSSSESSTFSSQASPSASNTSSSSSTSTFQVNSSLNFENEAFLLKELNIDLETTQKLKIKNEPNKDLDKLKRLTDFILNSNDNTNESENESQKTYYTIRSPSVNNDLKENIKELRQKLEETKSMALNYQSEMNQYVLKLSELNQKIKNIETINSKEGLYSNFLSQIEKSLNENQALNVQNLNELDAKFITEVTNKINKFKQDQEVKFTRLKQNSNAENQIKFNEAIKRVATEKDKQLEDLRQKQTQHIDKIADLELENNQLKIKLESQNVASNVIEEIDTNKTTNELLNCDQNETKFKLKELMLQEKINQLQKQLSMFHTLPITNNYYETIQLNSCNIEDVVLAVYSEEHGSYRVIHKTSNYLHFVYSAVFKNFEQKLCIKNQVSNNSTSRIGLVNTSQYSSSPQSDQADIMQLTETGADRNEEQTIQQETSITGSMQSDSTIIDNSENIFIGDKQPQWFVGKVLVKEFCVARRENNRFKVPSGTRFFRVKLKPYNLFSN